MSGSYKELRKKAVAEEFSSPELMNMRKKLAVCFIAFIVCRVAFSVYETVYIVLREADISFIISNLCLTALTAFLSYAIYNGASTLTFLAALGGAYSLVTNFASETVIRYITTQSDVAFNAYMAVLAVVSLIQIVMYIYIGASKKWKQYFAACLRVNGKLAER